MKTGSTNIKKKIAAFTLVELLIAMVLFTSVISLGLLLYSNMQKTLEKVKADNSYYLQYCDFCTILEKDFIQASIVKYQSNTLAIQKGNKEISYKIQENEVKRTGIGGHETTFPIKIQEIICGRIKGKDYVNSLDLHVSFGGNMLPVTLFKSYESKQLIQ